MPRRRVRSARSAGGAALAVAFVVGLAAASGWTQPAGEMQVTPAVPAQGDTFAIVVHAPPGSTVSVAFNGVRVSVFPAGAGLWRALRGTDPDTTPGAYVATATITPPGGAAHAVHQTVRIAATRFGVRTLTLPPQTAGLITPKNLAIEAEALRSVLIRRTPEALWHGPFHAPVTGPMDSPYGEQSVYNGRRMWWHQGADFDVPAGAPVAAPEAGIVALARALPLGGNTIVLDHGQGVLTEYLHLSAFAVREGARVAQGDLIGRIGATGLVTGPSLHWGLYVDGRWVNPLFWLEPRPGITAVASSPPAGSFNGAREPRPSTSSRRP